MFTYLYISFAQQLYFGNLVIGKGNCAKQTVILLDIFVMNKKKEREKDNFEDVFYYLTSWLFLTSILVTRKK